MAKCDYFDCEEALNKLADSKNEESSKLLLYSGKGINDLGSYEKCSDLNNARYMLMITSENFKNSVIGLCGPSFCSPQHYLKIKGNKKKH